MAKAIAGGTGGMSGLLRPSGTRATGAAQRAGNQRAGNQRRSTTCAGNRLPGTTSRQGGLPLLKRRGLWPGPVAVCRVATGLDRKVRAAGGVWRPAGFGRWSGPSGESRRSAHSIGNDRLTGCGSSSRGASRLGGKIVGQARLGITRLGITARAAPWCGDLWKPGGPGSRGKRVGAGASRQAGQFVDDRSFPDLPELPAVLVMETATRCKNGTKQDFLTTKRIDSCSEYKVSTRPLLISPSPIQAPLSFPGSRHS